MEQIQQPLRVKSPGRSLADCLWAAAALCASSLGWLALCVVAERREAWDSGAYFLVLLPLLCLAAARISWIRPERAWRWPAALAAGQVLGMAITSGVGFNLGPLPFVALGVISAPLFLSAAIAARRRRAQS